MSTSSRFMLLLRGGISNRALSPEQLQAQIKKYMGWIDSLQKKGHFLAGEPLDEEGKLLSGRNAETVTSSSRRKILPRRWKSQRVAPSSRTVER